jgi:hypothetical protein
MNSFWRLASLALLSVLTLPIGTAAQSCRDRIDHFGWYTPDFVTLKAGGHQGFMTLGAGYEFFDSRLQLGAQYGWVPPALGGRSLHNVTLNVTGHARGWCLNPWLNWSYIYGGLGLMFPIDSEGFFFVRVPERYGDRYYYRKTGLRLLATLGTELQIVQQVAHVTLTHGVFWEIAGLDEYFFIWSQNRGHLSFAYPWSSAIGYRLRF